MKTIREWFNELPEPFRTQALEASTARQLERSTRCISNAIHNGLIWSETPQGINYWRTIHQRYSDIEAEQRRLKYESTPLE